MKSSSKSKTKIVDDSSEDSKERQKEEKDFYEQLSKAKLSLSQKRQAIMKFQNVERTEKSPEKRAGNLKLVVQKLARRGELSEFASNDLIRLSEVMEEFYEQYINNTKERAALGDEEIKRSKTANLLHKKRLEEAKQRNKLEMRNRRRIRELNNQLDLGRRDRQLTKKDFETYERKKLDLFGWQRQSEKAADVQSVKQMAHSQQEKALDNMLGFKERTPALQLKRWEQNLQIKPNVLTTQVNVSPHLDLSLKQQRRIVRDIRKKQKREATLKLVKLAKWLKPNSGIVVKQ